MTVRRASVPVLLVLSGLAALPAHAAGDPARGGVLANTCMGCHGIAGYRNAYPSYRVPKLGGQKPDYLVAALQAYRSGERAHPTMRAQAATMTDQDMADIAAFFASQGEPKTAAAVTGGRAAAGKDKSAVCAACHGPEGISPTPVWPNLAGQHEDYIAQAIHEYQAGDRKQPVMGAQVAALSAEDVKDLAAYFSSQSGLFTVHYAETAKR